MSSRDDIYGNIATQGTCTTAIGTVLAANGGTYSCSFTGSFFGDGGARQTDVVTATAVDTFNNPAADSDDAVVTITNALPTIVVDKTATPLSRPEPGGSFTFNVVVTNTGIEPVTITSLTDDVYGNVAFQGRATQPSAPSWRPAVAPTPAPSPATSSATAAPARLLSSPPSQSTTKARPPPTATMPW